MPVGRNISVAGSSFIAVRKTKSVPRPMLGSAIGKTTEVVTRLLLLPRVAATSLRVLGTSCSADVMEATALARKSNAYAKANRRVDW